MLNRDKLPDAAFAFVGKIGEHKFKLLKHHMDLVKDPNDHNTVDKTLLIACLNMLKQAPLSIEQKNSIEEHLMEHAKALNLIVNEETGNKIINQQSGGKDGNANINLDNVNDKLVFPEDPQLTPDVGTVSGNPDPEEEKDGKKEVVKDQNDLVVTSPNKDKSATSTDKNKGKTNKKSGKRKSVYSSVKSGGIVTDNESFAIVKEVDEKATKIKIRSFSKKQLNKDNLTVLITESEGNPLDFDKIVLVDTLSQSNVGDISPKKTGIEKMENEDATSNDPSVLILDNNEKLVDNPNKDKFGKQSLIVKNDALTEEGKAFIRQATVKAFANKSISEFEIKKFGSKEMLDVIFDTEFGKMFLGLDIFRGSNDKVVRVDLLGSLDGAILEDVSKLLLDLSKDVEKSSSGAKLDSCVSQVKKSEIDKFVKDNGREPTAEEKKNMESSAFAICTKSVGK